jgi:hypothetical protein
VLAIYFLKDRGFRAQVVNTPTSRGLFAGSRELSTQRVLDLADNPTNKSWERGVGKFTNLIDVTKTIKSQDIEKPIANRPGSY